MVFETLPFPPTIVAAFNPAIIIGIVLLVGGLGFGVYWLLTRRITESGVQKAVHELEEGSWKTVVHWAIAVAFLLFMGYLWLFKEGSFKGLSHEKAIEQAQISRELARGHGFSTLMIRPAALYQFEQNTGSFNLERTPDTYHAPLNPLLNAPVLWLFKKYWEMSQKDVLYIPDAALMAVQLVWMILGWLVSYFTMIRLFDRRLAIMGTWLLILCQSFWDFAVSGLPQNLLFFLFAVAMYCLVRAVENRTENRPSWFWLFAVAVCFGLLALAHALTLWIFAGLILFVAFFFRDTGLLGKREEIREDKPNPGLAIGQRLAVVGIMCAIVALMYAPWMVRNSHACGNPVGLGWYSGLHQIKGSEPAIMRSMEPPFDRVSPGYFRSKIQNTLLGQFGHLYEYLGYVLVAPIFLVALLHFFKRPTTSAMRWALLAMWIGALLGMSVFGLEGKPVSMPFAPPVEANDLHILFVPLFTAYGLAFILVMWTRLEINVKLVRWGFIGLIFIVSSLRFAGNFIELNGQAKSRVQWPPYVPPFIAILNQWTTEREIIASDMPWAVAWYADRKSLWLPISIKNFIELNDYNQLNGNIVGLYLTPFTGNQPFMPTIIKGDYKEWAPFILRQVTGPALKDFPLRAMTPLPLENECIFYSDRDRWTPRED